MKNNDLPTKADINGAAVYVYGLPLEECPTEKLKRALSVFATWRCGAATQTAIISAELSRRAAA